MRAFRGNAKVRTALQVESCNLVEMMHAYWTGSCQASEHTTKRLSDAIAPTSPHPAKRVAFCHATAIANGLPHPAVAVPGAAQALAVRWASGRFVWVRRIVPNHGRDLGFAKPGTEDLWHPVRDPSQFSNTCVSFLRFQCASMRCAVWVSFEM